MSTHTGRIMGIGEWDDPRAVDGYAQLPGLLAPLSYTRGQRVSVCDAHMHCVRGGTVEVEHSNGRLLRVILNADVPGVLL